MGSLFGSRLTTSLGMVIVVLVSQGKEQGSTSRLLSASFLFFLFSLNCYKLRSSSTIKKKKQQQQQQTKANHRYLISSNNSRGRLLFFSHKKGVIIRGNAVISNIAHWKSCPFYCFIFPLNKKMTK